MLAIIIGSGLLFMLLERLFPDQDLPEVPGWWLRVIVVNLLQLGVVILGDLAWNQWFDRHLLDFATLFSPQLGGFVTYIALTFVFYWWHRWRHDVNLLWLGCHQLHHSASRIETITSFYKHPLELVLNGIIIAFVNFGIFGLSIEGALWVNLYSALAEFFYHMNIKTPHWVGYFFQRPEMHRIHHKAGLHYNNFSDLPVWDMLFGTWENPESAQSPCGFKSERELRFIDILCFKNVNNPFPLFGIRRKGSAK
jgi:sterol desaturase/sphingolipid hydroxylase (fatty acid hydroxylase superfamily)